MVRKLKYHEQKLLKKVDFISWEADNNLHEVKMMKRYHIKKRDEYTTYNQLAREIRVVASKIKNFDSNDPFRAEQSARLLEKLYQMGLINSTSSLELADTITASSFCRRRLPVIMKESKMVETVKMATQAIEHGHVRIGPELVKDPAFIVTRSMQDFITWVDSSKYRQHVLEYNDMRDDFLLS